MIAQPQPRFQPAPWQQILADAVSNPLELLRMLEIDPTEAGIRLARGSAFRQRVPRGFVARMRKGDPGDPLLRQVLPLAAEDEVAPGYLADPVGDLNAEAVPGVLHKYDGRALLIATGACAVHCRYCFRRHFPYGDSHAAADRWTRALAYLSGDTSITEVILSGGDPLSLADARLAELSARLDAIPHLQRLRLHTRLPVVLPERVDEPLTTWLAASRLKPVVVIHANHRNELDASVGRAMRRLRDAGAMLLNQSVLLKGINDDVVALADLSEALIDNGVLPYYLHQLDPVQGAAHFAVGDMTARRLVTTLRDRLPGYLVPRLVREIPGAPAKQPLE